MNFLPGDLVRLNDVNDFRRDDWRAWGVGIVLMPRYPLIEQVTVLWSGTGMSTPICTANFANLQLLARVQTHGRG